MVLRNGYIQQLLKKYSKYNSKTQSSKQKQIKDYQLLMTYLKDKRKSEDGFYPIIVRLQLRRLEEIAADSTELVDDDWAVLETALVPVSYVRKLLGIEIAQYAKRGIKINMVGEYYLLNFSPKI